ncbi:expressed unknown protein [Seminavis robusta]|uniref:Uncharacterized protein n=1 Tax=Seminavis robusta TaxID=568900 RepID=A0A9N8EFB9_9STRA|nr:expressed unknown protein [Seminavis robusta]|eukprot:Sro1100_g241330.1 n/a (395) ;mRNA; r:34065-35499
MLRSISLLLAFIAAAGAKTIVPDFDVKADSKLGKKLLSKARALNEERDWTWVANYSIKYRGCASIVSLANEENGGGEGSPLYTQNLVKFSLCPADATCDTCKGGSDYVVSMMEFLDAWTEWQMNALERTCENIRENCYCNNNYNDDEACENQCFNEAEMTECIQYEGDEEFEVQRYLECAEMEDGNNNNNNNNNNGGNGNGWYGQYYIGPYCSEKDGYSIHLGLFYDEGCSARADASTYADQHYGVALPFSEEAIVKDECISCMQVDEDDNNNNNNNNNNNQNGNNYYYYQDLEVNELCEAVYEPAAKCESNLDVTWPDTAGCEYIQNILPRLEKATRGASSRSSSSASSGGAAVGFAWVFAISTIIFASYAFFLYRKLDRNRVDLSSADGALA